MRVIVLIFALTSLTACASTKQYDVIEQGAIVKHTLETQEARRIMTNEELNATDVFIINHTFNAWSAFLLSWQHYATNPEALTVKEKEQLLTDYVNLKIRYKELEMVIARNWDNYPAHEQQGLLNIRGEIFKLNDKVETAILHHQIKQALKNILRINLKVLKIGVASLAR